MSFCSFLAFVTCNSAYSVTSVSVFKTRPVIWLLERNYFQVIAYFSCSYDYVIITNEEDFIFGDYAYCGDRTGLTVLVTGGSVVIKFFSDNAVQRRGFHLLFSAIPHGKKSNS